ncbi:autotransporter domain-containing protein [Mangrovicella endophytica]|uniref:autotransporter family protein n=1 Tax=Mangrovicella endophytica TaxID=2066697 RepID=UPI000C9DEB6C|nr:autotransporter domain-containing protein [Mangrovicella endophytica]
MIPRISLTLLATSSALTLAGLLGASGAHAACAPDPVGNGGTVSCTGTDTNGFQTTSSGVSLTVTSGAVVQGPARFDGPIELGSGATLVNNGTIDANLASTAVFAGPDATVTNNGTITAPAGQGLTLQGGSFVNSAGAVIDITAGTNEGTSGVLLGNGGSIRNEGEIYVSGDNVATGLIGSGGATVTNAEGATLSVAGFRGVGINGSSESTGTGNTLVNAGTLLVNGSGFGGAGMLQSYFGVADGVTTTLTNTATGVIEVEGERVRGILTSPTDRAINAGTITATGSGSGGISLVGDESYGENSGTIRTFGELSIGVSMTPFSSGQRFVNTGTVAANGGGSGLAFEGGEIGFSLTGATAVLMLGQDGLLENSGSLLAGQAATGSGSSAIVVGAVTEADLSGLGAAAYDGNRIVNSGVIQGDGSGIRLVADPQSGAPTLTIQNAAGGGISGSDPDSTGIVSEGGVLVIDNAGTIRGGSFGIDANGGITLTNRDGATLSGFDAALRSRGTFNDTFTNAGLASGLVDLGGGDDVIIVLPTADFAGGVEMGAGFDTVAFDGAAGTVGDAAFLRDGVPFATGVERIEKRGEGTWRFVSEETIPAFVDLAPAFVLDGTVILGITAPSLDLTNTVGGRVEGVGTLRNLVNEGELAVGGAGATGTLNVAGNLTLDGTGTTYMDIAADGTSDLLAVTGSANIGGSLLVNGIAYPTGYPDAQSYTIITAGGGVSGTFSSVADNLPDVDVVALYNANDVQLSYDRDGSGPVDPEDPDDGFTRKENALASVYALGHAALSFSETLAGRGGRSAAAQRTSLGGIQQLAYGEDEPRASELPASKAIYGADLGTTAAAMTGPDGGVRVWIGAFGDDLSVDPDGGAAGYDSNSAGVAGGVEYVMTGADYTAVIGLAGGYSSTDVDIVAGGAAIDTGHVGLYAAWEQGPLALNGAIAYSFADFDLARAVLTSTASGSADGDAVSGYTEISYDIVPLIGGTGYRLAPAARLRGVHATRDAFTETGAGILNLSVNEDDVSLLYGGIGLKAETEIVLGSAVLTPELSVFYEHNFADNDRTGFATVTPAAVGFETLVSAGAEDAVAVGAGLGARFTETISGRLRYDGTFGDDMESHRGSATLSFAF